MTFTETFWKDFGFQLSVLTPFSLQPLCWYLPVMKTSVHLPLCVSQLWKHEWEGMFTWDVEGKLRMQFGGGSAACLFWCVRTLVFSCVSTLVPILWAQNCKCSCLPVPLRSVDTSGDVRYRCSQIAAAQWKQLQMQVIAHGFKGRFTSLKLMVLERLLISYLLIKVREGVMNG